ncbi:MAG: DRTGG domain-containing protein [Candidatus Hadarchaeia archaeon]
MTRILSVISTQDKVGKTAIAIAIASLGQERGLDVGYMKPVGTRLRSRLGKPVEEDSVLAKRILDLEAEPQELTSIIYSQPFIDQVVKGLVDPETLRKEVVDNFERRSEGKDLMIVEGGSNIDTGGIIDLSGPDLTDIFGAKAVLVTNYKNLNDLDGILSAAGRLGDRLLGVIFNSVSDLNSEKLETVISPFLEARGIPVLGTLPRRKRLAGITVEELRENLGARALTGVSEEGLIERFLVGAMTGESALRYLRRTKCAGFVTGGDRPGVQRAALESSGVKCLILTGGLKPPKAIIGKAEEKGVPILLVQSDTLTTVEAAEEALRSERSQGEEAVKIIKDLIVENADINTIFGTEEVGFNSED